MRNLVIHIDMNKTHVEWEVIMKVFICGGQMKMRVSKGLVGVMFTAGLNVVIGHCEDEQKQSCLVVRDFKIVTVLWLI